MSSPYGKHRKGSFAPASVVLVGLVLAGLVASVAFPEAPSDEALSPRNANYTLEVRLDPSSKRLDGRQTLTWTNLQDRPADELPFHLYWNAWRDSGSNWMRESRRQGRRRPEKLEPEDWGYLEVESARLLTAGGKVELEGRYLVADEGEADDKTVWAVSLPQAVEPGETISVELEWHARVPRTFARTGARGHFFFVAHWFPKLGVWEPEGWNCHSFHALTEFYSDYGVYDVAITVPESFVVGATGQRVERAPNGDGTVTHRYVEEDVHAFTWTASPDFVVREKRFEVSGLPPVEIRLLLQPEHLDQEARHFAATEAALEYYGRWYGPYPYGHITVVDPAWGSRAGGMEYPTLFTAGTRLFNPVGGGSPEGVTVHEAGHQFWYGIVGNNEFEHAWLDEGLNTFSTARVMDTVFGERYWSQRYLDPPGKKLGGFLPVLFRDVPLSRAIFGNRFDRFLSADAATAGPPSDPTYRYFPAAGSRLSYDKTSLWLATLERFLGWETLQRILSAHFDRWAFRHPRPEDFFAVANEVAGQDLGWFFDQVYDSSVTFDYTVDSVSSLPAARKGIEVKGGEVVALAAPEVEGAEEDPETVYRSEVIVRRRAEGIFPVDVLLVFEDGSEVRHAWSGRDSWKLFVEERRSKLRYAAVDPERILLLDLNYTNNSRFRESEAAFPARKWASKWMVRVQDLLSTASFFF